MCHQLNKKQLLACLKLILARFQLYFRVAMEAYEIQAGVVLVPGVISWQSFTFRMCQASIPQKWTVISLRQHSQSSTAMSEFSWKSSLRSLNSGIKKTHLDLFSCI